MNFLAMRPVHVALTDNVLEFRTHMEMTRATSLVLMNG